ncbi:MAG: hypothetical protein DMD30_10395 [Gemmatimonadetes bacterium]|nr:MAG: hypothetical protein DMD30_10395 [Gemmatimonadota bacterium]PYP52920.1 MAG: hypothetical protein DMD39_06065 [Gemmatimonadota bacterium]
MNRALRTYTGAPVWMQNLLLSAYGVRLRRLRYGSVGQKKLASLRESQWMSAEEIHQYQLSVLTEVVARAASDVPFYRRRGLEGIDFESFDQLRELPLLTKSEVQRARSELISDKYSRSRLTELHTGGTTGKPLAIYADRATVQTHYAFFTRLKEWAGIRDGERVATFAGRTVVPPGAGEPYWRHNRTSNTLLCSSFHVGPATAAAYVKALADFSPRLIDAYPSSIEPIVRFLADEPIRRVSPAAVITSSETLFPAVRSLIERAFGCGVFDYYCGGEMAAFIAQCEEGTYHVAPEFGVVELLADGRPVGPGERGEIVATPFINPVMPLLRYATGDSAVRGSQACPCGRAGQTIERIEGRIDDVIVTPEGHFVGRLDSIFKSVSSISETRVIQDGIDHVRVEIVTSEGFTGQMQGELETQLRLRLGPTMRIDIVRVAAIGRTERGKLRTMVNLVYRQTSTGVQKIIT